GIRAPELPPAAPPRRLPCALGADDRLRSTRMGDALTLTTALPPEGIAAVDALGPLDALVAVTALNQARSAPGVVGVIASGLARGFAGRRTAVLFVDGGSQDGTLEAVAQHPATDPAVAIASVGVAGRPGRGRAVVAALAAARHVGARAAAIVDGGLVSA